MFKTSFVALLAFAGVAFPNDPPPMFDDGPPPMWVADNAGERNGCVCGDACVCQSGNCPAKCPVAKAGVKPVVKPVTYHWEHSPAYGWVQVPDGYTLLNATPLPVAPGAAVGNVRGGGFYPYPTAGNCSNGTCR